MVAGRELGEGLGQVPARQLYVIGCIDRSIDLPGHRVGDVLDGIPAKQEPVDQCPDERELGTDLRRNVDLREDAPPVKAADALEAQRDLDAGLGDIGEIHSDKGDLLVPDSLELDEDSQRRTKVR